MKIYLVRHGEAVSEEVAGSDRDRWLNERGRQHARGLAKLLRENNVELDAVLSSPLPRAVQTAERLADGLDYFGQIVTLRALEPSAQPNVIAQQLKTYGRSVMLVGHEPNISALGAMLLGLPAFQPFRTAQCCAFEDGQPVFSARADLMLVTAMFRD
ncbi:MAG: phosphohistidine phosphatase SixA [Kofleriaceae bacterium]|nr:phosphohistidine phosphatase SixA [Kofleriaceae bacterium]